MREMKESGVEWIGDIPKDWNCIKGKYILSYLQKPVLNTDGVITCFRSGEVTLRNKIREEGYTFSEKEIGYQGIDIGDLVVHGMDGFAGSIGISDSRGKGSPVLNVLDSNQNKKYIMYYLRSMAYHNVFLALATGIRVRSCDLRWNKLSELYYPVPSIKEQLAIADFLDKKCLEIDSLTKDIQEEIKVLEKYKRSVIFEAVTKGLDPNTPMKDSGVEWIGKIPSHWTTTQLKYVCTYNTDVLPNNTNPSFEFDYVDIGSVSFANGIEKVERMNFAKAPSRARRIVRRDDIVVSTVRTYLKAITIIPSFSIPLIVSTGFLVVRAKINCVSSSFLGYVLKSDSFTNAIEANSAGVSYPAIASSEAVKTCVTLPPIKEQLAIADFLDKKCSAIDDTIAKKKEQLEVLADYKKSLIYEYVTGKKEVLAHE